MLNKKYYIPQSMIDGSIIELLEKIRNGRDSTNNVATDLIKIIERYSGKNIFNKNDKYVKRCERELCRNTLNTESVLLLTGVSFCGKTYLAKDIAQEYLDNGYKVEITGEIYGDNGAISFLRNRSIEDRLLILEDPFGQVETKKDAISILNEVRNLISEVKENRKLIITSRKDIILDITDEKCISECSINSHSWVDLTLKECNEILIPWENYFGGSVESKKLFDEIYMWLIKNEKTYSLQLGHIANIFNNIKDLHKLLKLGPEKIITMARIDSKDLASIIKNRGHIATKVFIALGLSCNTYKSISLDDLSFILSDSNSKASICEDNDHNIVYCFKEVVVESFPKYNESIKINDEFMRELKYLNRHGYIEIDNLRRIKFVHPIYHYATSILFKRYFCDMFEQENIINIVKQSLSSLSINANLCTLIMLENIYIEDQDESIKTLILESLNSIFPSVRDRVVMFFDSRVNELNESEQDKFVNALKYGNDVNESGVLWNNGMPWINQSKERSFLDMDWFNYDIGEDDIDSLVKKIDDGIILSSEEMWQLLKVRDGKVKSLKVLEKALLYDESFIRENSIRIIFTNYAFDFDKLDDYLDIYEHPNVIYSLFRGALDSWLKYSNQSKKLILEYYKKSLSKMSVAIISKKFLENFEDEHSYESIDWSGVEEKDKIELWNVWHEIFVEFLNKFPSKYISMNEGHMVLVTETSLNYINSEEKVVELAIAWFNWLDRYLEYNTPQDYGMSVAKYLINGTKYNSISRKDIFKMMLLTNKTSFITTNVKIFVDSWKYLSNDEKNLILDLLKSNRNDIKWIMAVVLNRGNIPNEIQVALLGESIEGKEVSEIVDILIEKNILEQCLNVHCGYPQPLYWNGYHHINYKLWDSVIIEVLKRNNLNRIFSIALREIIDLIYNHNNRRIYNIYDIYEDLLKCEEKRKLVFERLLTETVSQNQCNKRAWDLLFQYSTDNEKEYYYDIIAEDIELVEEYQINHGNLFALFDKAIVYGKIYPRLEIDNNIRLVIEGVLKVDTILKNDCKEYSSKECSEGIKKSNYKNLEKYRLNFKEAIVKQYDNNPPRLFSTDRLVRLCCREIGLHSVELDEVIEKNRQRRLNIMIKLRGKYNDHYNIENWNE